MLALFGQTQRTFSMNILKNIIHKVYVHILMTKRSAITSLLKTFVVLCVQPPAKKDRETPKLMNVMETLVDIVCWVQTIA